MNRHVSASKIKSGRTTKIVALVLLGFFMSGHCSSVEEESDVLKRAMQDNAYIRFGKRQQQHQPDDYVVRRAVPNESGFIRFGKRAKTFGDNNDDNNDKRVPCSLPFLRSLPNDQLRWKHLKDCSIRRSIRSPDDAYIRFGKRSSSSSQRCVYMSPSSEQLFVRSCDEHDDLAGLRDEGDLVRVAMP